MIQTNSIEKVLSYNNHWRPENVTFSVSELSSSSEYQLWLGYHKTPRTHKQPLELKVNSTVGSGFHLLAEQAMADEPDVLIEPKFMRHINGHWISGSADLVRENTEHGVIFEDYKTKGVYQAKKAMQGENEDVTLQLSIYRYLYWLGSPNANYCDYGLVNVIVTGDQGYMNKADGGGKVPKYMQIPIKLWSIERTEKFIKYKIDNASKPEEPVVDCEAWRCDYCQYECQYRKE